MMDNNKTPEAVRDLKLVFDTLCAKATKYGALWDYYSGNHVLKWTSKKIQEVFRSDTLQFVQNWAAVVVDVANDRIALERFDVPDATDATARLSEIFDDTDLDLDQDSVHLDAIITGESFVIACEEDGEVLAYHNDARTVCAVYEKERPNVMRVAGKWWVDDDGYRRITLYYPGRIEYWASTQKAESQSSTWSAGHWVPFEQGAEDNPYDQIPVFHFRTDRRIMSCLQNVIPLQDVVNKTLADMMVCSEFGAYPQRWAIANIDGDGRLPYGPGTTLQIPPADNDTQPVSVGTFPAADLANFIQVMDHMAQAMAVISRTPKHFFWSQTGVPSGEALIAMEAPLNKRIGRYVKRFSATWDALGRFLLKLDGKGDVQRVQPIFADHRTVQPITQSIIRKANVGAGMPLETNLRMEGWTEEQLDQLATDRANAGNEGIPPALPEVEREARIATQAKALEPNVQELVQALGDAVTDHLVKSGAVERIVRARANGK